MHSRSHVRSRFGPIILIIIGAIFLLINFGIVPVAELKAMLAKWWPLILVVVGVWQLARPSRDEQQKS
jgi:hypothetical protein